MEHSMLESIIQEIINKPRPKNPGIKVRDGLRHLSGFKLPQIFRDGNAAETLHSKDAGSGAAPDYCRDFFMLVIFGVAAEFVM